MKKILAVSVGLVLALAPTSSALADDAPTNNGRGNCGYSAAGGGVKVVEFGGAGNGFGGRMKGGVFNDCVRNVFIGPIAGSN